MRSIRIKHALMLILYKQIHVDNLKLCSAQTISETIKLWKTKFENHSVPDAQVSIDNIVAHVLGFKSVSHYYSLKVFCNIYIIVDNIIFVMLIVCIN